MTALSATVFIGLQTGVPNLRKMIVSRVKQHNMHDIKVSAFTGIRDEDIAILESLEGDNTIEYVSTDTFFLKSGEYSIKLYTQTDTIDRYIIKEGRLPESTNEIALDYKHFTDHGDMVGKTISFSNKTDDEENNLLNNTEFKVVGYVYSVDYIMNQRASGQAGDGNYFGVVEKGVIDKEFPDYAIMHLGRNKGYDIASDKYKLFETKTIDEISTLFEARPKDVEELIKSEANSKLADARKEIQDGKDELQKARDDLAKAEKDLEQAKQDIEDGKITLEDNERKFRDEIADAKIRITEAQHKIDQGQTDLIKGRIEYAQGLNQFNQEINKAEQELNQGKKDLDDAKTLLENSRKQYEDGLKQYDDGKKQIEEGKIELEKSRKLLSDGKTQLADEKQKLLEQKADLEKTKNELAENLKKIQDGIKQIEKNIPDGYTLAKAESEMTFLDIALQLTDGTIDILKELSALEPAESEEIYTQRITTILEQIRQLRNLITSSTITDPNIKARLDEIVENLDKLEELLTNSDDLPSSVKEALSMLQEERKKLASNKDLLQQLIDALTMLSKLKQNERDILNGQTQVEMGLAQIEAGLKTIESKKQELDANQALLDSESKKLEAAEKELKASKIVLDDALVQIEQGERDLRAGTLEYQEGLAEFHKKRNEGKAKLDAALAEIETGQKEIDENQRLLDKSRYTLTDEEKAAQDKLDAAREDLNDGEQKYQEGLKDLEEGKEKFEKEEPDALADIADGEKSIKDIQSQLDELRIPLYNIQGKYDNTAFLSYIDQAKSLNSLSYIFTLMFYLVAILVTLTTILRMVETERTQIGTMKALGYSRRTILNKYLAYGLSAGIIGAILGIIVGYYLFMPPVISAYITATNLANNPMIFEYDKALLIFFVTIVIISATIILAIMNNLRENAASLMRPKPPKEAKRTLLEKVPSIWNKLSFLNKVAFRNVMRHKIRMLMTIAGVSGSFALIAMAFGLQYSIDTVSDKQFGDVYKYSAQLVYDDNADDYNDLVDNLNKQSNGYISIIYQSANVKTPSGFTEDINIVATDDIIEINEYISLKNRLSEDNYILKHGYVIISEKLANSLDKGVGDIFVFRDPNGVQRQLEIMAITEQYFNHQIYMTEKTYLEVIDDKADQNTFLIKLDAFDNKSIDAYEKILNDFDANISFMPVLDMEETLNSLSDSLNVIIILIIAISAMLTFVVLYNLTNINISERVREISTIKVLGFRPREVSSYILKENYILTFIGMLVGIALARVMHLIIVYSLSPGAFLFNPYMNPISYLYAALIVTLFTLFVMYAANREMNKINMVEALKAVD